MRHTHHTKGDLEGWGPLSSTALIACPRRATANKAGRVVRDEPLTVSCPRLSAFTLLELLAVIAVIALLTGIVIGVGRRASDAGKVARAKAELAVISAALESYKRQYGDYPQAGGINFALPDTALGDGHSNVRLYNALLGHYGPRINQLNPPGRAFIELARFSTDTAQAGMATALSTGPELNALLDPWGNRYMYYYRGNAGGSTWQNPSYVLYSVGPDGAMAGATEGNCHAPPDGSGFVDFDDDRNADNIYANRN